MATIVCRHQGLKSCLESQLVESRTLRLKLSSPKPHFTQQPLELSIIKSCIPGSKKVDEKCQENKNTEQSWSFLESISNGSNSSSSNSSQDSKLDKETKYVHPLVKRSLCKLSEKSLELCTENLGSETGTADIIENNNLLNSMSSSSSSTSSESPRNGRYSQQNKAKKARSSFPPPLTTISGSESLQIRPHREDGRLVIKATNAPSSQSIFHVERSDGRLRLSLFRDSKEVSIDDHQVEADEEIDQENEANEGEEEEDMNGEKIEVEGKIGMKKIQRCKESENCCSSSSEKNVLLNREAFCGGYILKF